MLLLLQMLCIFLFIFSLLRNELNEREKVERLGMIIASSSSYLVIRNIISPHYQSPFYFLRNAKLVNEMFLSGFVFRRQRKLPNG